MKLKPILGILLLGYSILGTGQQGEKKGGEDRRVQVSEFKVSRVPAMQALLELGRKENVSFGIVADDDRLCETRVSYSGRNVSLPVVVKSIVAQVPGYSWGRAGDASVLLITPVSIRPVTEQFLNVVDDQYGPVKANLQTLALTLWVHIRYNLYPDRGVSGNVLGSSNDRTFQLEAKDATVQQILDRIAVITNGTWVLRPLPSTLANLGGDLPFAVFASFGRVGPEPSGLCAPVVEQTATR